MSREACEALPIADRYPWCYERTHAQLDEMGRHVSHRFDLATEDLGQEGTRKALLAFVDLPTAKVPPAVRLSAFAYADVSQFDPGLVTKGQ